MTVRQSAHPPEDPCPPGVADALTGEIPRPGEKRGAAIKRMFDIVISLMALIIALPLAALVALVVVGDGGPALFAHERLGRGGRSFRCLKFRTMVVDAEHVLARHLASDAAAAAEWRAIQKLRDDPRVTRWGRFLRRSGLDELPQLLNVLRGDMSLVGPRPIVAEEVARYGESFAIYTRVRPGITGLWQVSGRNDVDYARRVEMDVWYVKNRSAALDAWILLKTVPAVLRYRGAY